MVWTTCWKLQSDSFILRERHRNYFSTDPLKVYTIVLSIPFPGIKWKLNYRSRAIVSKRISSRVPSRFRGEFLSDLCYIRSVPSVVRGSVFNVSGGHGCSWRTSNWNAIARTWNTVRVKSSFCSWHSQDERKLPFFLRGFNVRTQTGITLMFH